MTTHLKGRIHSFDTFGTVDGPGIRFVLFMQGCALQCGYCHNPDSWNTQGGKAVEIEEIMKEIEPYLPYYRRSGGGLTVTGGEPTLQAPFVARLFAECRSRWGLHTALDTSGFCEPEHAAELLAQTDLVLLDIKHIDPRKHQALTGQPNERILRFARHLSRIGQPTWLRHVLVPGVTDGYSDLRDWGAFAESLGCVDKIELLPYHRMGVYKWRQLGWPYPLENMMPPTERDMERARTIVALGREAQRKAAAGVGE